MQLSVRRGLSAALFAALLALALAVPMVADAQTPGVVCDQQGDLTPEQSIELAQTDPERDADNDGFACEDNIDGGQPTSTAAEYQAQQDGDGGAAEDDAADDDGAVPTPSRIDTGAGGAAETYVN